MVVWGYQRSPNSDAPNGEFFGSKSRSSGISMIVIHTAETEPDYSVPDTTAERLSSYMGKSGRPVSWHTTVDADSVIHELPSEWTASHVRGWNSRTVGIEIGTKSDLWEQMPGDHAALLIENTARAAAWFCKTNHIPAEQVESLDQARAGRRGLVAHSTLDPTRGNPGARFPWEYLVARVADLVEADAIVGIGDRGTKVSDVQARLTELGYGDLVGAIDGTAGPKFDAAVRAYEMDRGFSATGLWIPQSDAHRSPITASEPSNRQLVWISDSVGVGGANRPDDVRTVGDRLDQLGFMRPDRSLEHCIRLFQTAHDGGESLHQTEGRIDPAHNSLAWLNAANAPRWQRMPAGSEGEGFRSRERLQRSNDHGWGTDWLAETLERAGAYHAEEYLDRNPAAPLIWNNAASPLAGGEVTADDGQPAGLQLDIALPPQGASSRGLTVDSPSYDRETTRSIIAAFRKRGDIDVIYLNDNVLIAEGLCQRAPGHDDHLQVRIRPPERIDPQAATGTGRDLERCPSLVPGHPIGFHPVDGEDGAKSYESTRISSLAGSTPNPAPAQ